MYRNVFMWGALLAMLLSACQNHFISDANERKEVEQTFERRKEVLKDTHIFDVFTETMTREENEAMRFMYAYMPLGDLTDYPGEFHLAHVKAALRARAEMPWGKDIPERKFRHFVLPYRVNNENMDSARIVFYRELKPRIENMSLKEAVLEINHWCHEKVAYTPSDMRTSAPLASVRTAYGRCGEESTFAVSAFRAMGIPARQVYTPRWAHTDDNHAWVEVWVDGKWHFLGACEPEPVLDLAWFNAPASRGMLMHTKVFGHYHGPEEVMETTDNYTEINVIDNYADTATTTVTVTSPNGQPVEGALVEFKLYNYAEFYTVARKTTDAHGQASLTAGLGDMLVWASTKDGRYGFRQCSFGKDKELTITLASGQTGQTDLDITVPVEKAHIPDVTPEQRAENDRRFALEDSIRHAYIATFPTETQARQFAESNGYNASDVVPLIVASRGNHSTIQTFLQEAGRTDRDLAVRLLRVLSEKDLRDVELRTLREHFLLHPDMPADCPQEIYDKYLLNPRVANEMILPYRELISQTLSVEIPESTSGTDLAHELADWCRTHIRLLSDWNPQRIPMSPAGICKTRVADEYSLQIFFVAAARSFGIPARIDEVTGKVQYYLQGKPVDISLTGQPTTDTAQGTGTLLARYTPTSWLDDAKYYNHFTLSRLEKGRLQLLNYPETGTTWNSLLREGTKLDAGDYVLTTGTRLANGNVLSRLTFFTVREGEKTIVDLTLREAKDAVQVIGNFNSESLFTPKDGSQEVSLLSVTGRGYYVLGLLDGQEPSNHALRDIAACAGEFDQWGRPMVLLFPDKDRLDKVGTAGFPTMPEHVTWGIDTKGTIRQDLITGLKLNEKQGLPIFIVADTFNRVVFVVQGYTIGLGEQLMKTLHAL